MTDCYLTTKYFQKSEFGDLDIHSTDHCEYIEGKVYLGKEIKAYVAARSKMFVVYGIGILTIYAGLLALFLFLAYLDRKGGYSKKEECGIVGKVD